MTTLFLVGISGLALLVLVGAILALSARSLVVAAVALGLGSASLAMLFFLLDAPYAGGFELSVGAGLVSVMFLVAISLTTALERRPDDA